MKTRSKTDYKLYLRSREYANFIGKSAEILEIFGYNKTTYILRIKQLTKFIMADVYKHPSQYWKIRDLAAVESNILEKYTFEKINFYKNIYGPSSKELFLVPRNLVPFYLLKEYGGEII